MSSKVNAAVRVTKKVALLSVLFVSSYGLLNLAWLGPWTFQQFYWRPHLTYGDSSDQIRVTLRTPSACQLQVVYQVNTSGGTWGAPQTVGEEGPATTHSFLLDNLVPGVAVKYRVEPSPSNQGTLYSDISRDLAREYVIPANATFDPSARRSFKFAVYGDTRPTVFGTEIHHAVAAAIRGEDPDFVIHTGDMVQTGGSNAEWARFFTTGEVLYREIPTMPTPGNHEYYTGFVLGQHSLGSAANYLEAYDLPGAENYYAYNVSNAHFVSLDVSSGSGSKSDEVQTAQVAWLDDHLAHLDKAAFDWLFVFFHYPIVSTSETHECVWSEFLGPLFDKYNLTIDMLFVGHVHQYERLFLKDANCWSLVAGGGGADLEQSKTTPQVEGSEVLELSHSFAMVEVDGLTLHGRGLFMGGGQFDQFTLTKPVGGL
ncbi:MAG: metallophosphoesterase [Promethearchaeota archaeon]